MASPELDKELKQIQEQLKELVRLVSGTENNSIDRRVLRLENQMEILNAQVSTRQARVWQITTIVLGAIITATIAFMSTQLFKPQPQPTPSVTPAPSPSETPIEPWIEPGEGEL